MFKDDYKRTFSAVRPSAEFDPEEIYMKANQKRTPMRRVVSVALAAALLLALSLTAYATDLFGIKDFIMPDDYQSGPTIENAAENASTRQPIAIHGYADSSEAVAYAEWDAYYWEYVENNKIADEDSEGLPQVAGYYGAYNREMYDQLLKTAAKYDLKLVENVESGGRKLHLLNGTEGTYYQYSNGSFKESGDFTSSDGVVVGYSIIRTVKGSMPTAGFEIWDADQWSYWSHTTPAGEPVAVGLSDTLYDAYGSDVGQRGLVMADLGDCFVTVIVYDWNKDCNKTVMTELAENIDYARLAAIE